MITVADSAKLRLKTFPMPDKAIGVRLGVRSSGCSGLAYVLEFCYNSTVEDTVILVTGPVPIFIDNKSMIHLTGTRLEYNKRGLNEGFEFVNPNVTSECGCGESFYVE
jgi:iron-sulfur cluster assembly protein|tara:strand:+ start:169 stop:492 length:324 start_codon:yes stop_codon:yes gene_type:complete